MLSGAAVSFHIPPLSQPSRLYHIKGAFTAQQLSLAEHTHPVKTLREKYHHLRGLPLSHLEAVRPVLLIGSDYPHLIMTVEPIRQQPSRLVSAGLCRALYNTCNMRSLNNSLFTSMAPPETDLLKQVERLWQIDPDKTRKQ